MAYIERLGCVVHSSRRLPQSIIETSVRYEFCCVQIAFSNSHKRVRWENGFEPVLRFLTRCRGNVGDVPEYEFDIFQMVRQAPEILPRY